MSIHGKNLQEWGLPPGKAYSVALKLFGQDHTNPKEAEQVIRGIVNNAEDWLYTDFEDIAKAVIDDRPKSPNIRQSCVPVKIYGEGIIEGEALSQIYAAAKLPVSVKAAIMPDGHSGYGLPIGGVLATLNAVIPFAVGYDIGCRMHMSVLPITEKDCMGKLDMFARILCDNTVFGKGKHNDDATLTGMELNILDDMRFRDIPAVKKAGLHSLAIQQMGTSGSGNHFVEFGFVQLPDFDVRHLAILSHSGSRGVGHKIATIYTELALNSCKLPGQYKNLAWLGMDTEAGQEYWGAMNLSGDFARACHHMIHRSIMKDLKVRAEMVFENHHNFAWKEMVDGQEVIVHRKGATPAGKGVTGIIPGSMSTNTYIVRGKGNPDSINSSSHGAGRSMSRSAAKLTFTMSQMRKDLEAKGVTLIGGSLDECTFAYKDIDKVIAEQSELVETIGQFQPWIVRMSEEEEKPWQKD